MEPIILDCRQHTLDMGDELLNELSPDGRAAFAMFVDAGRRKITQQVPKSLLEFYRKPR